MQEQIQFTGENAAAGVDQITFEVIRGALQAVCNEAGIVLMKGAMSMVINQGQDFSAAVLTPDGGLVMQGEEDFPCFITMMSPSTKAFLKECPKEDMRPGDVYICNDPYRGGTHKPDVRMLRPVFWEGEIVGLRQQLGPLAGRGRADTGKLPSGTPATRSRKASASRPSRSPRTMPSSRTSRSSFSPICVCRYRRGATSGR